MHLERNGSWLLSNGLEYVRVLGRGPMQPSTTTNGLLLKVSIQPEMAHPAGIRIAQSGQVYMSRKLNATSVHARMPRYILIDNQLDWMAVIPAGDMEKTRLAVGSSVSPAAPPRGDSGSSVSPSDPPNGNSAAQSHGNNGSSAPAVRVRNSLLAMDSSFLTAAYQLARDHGYAHCSFLGMIWIAHCRRSL